MTYKEYTKARQDEYNNLPIKYAFGYDQFYKILKEEGWKENDVVSIGYGGYMQRKDLPKLKEFTENDKINELMKDYDFAYEAIFYEMGNHEYHINWEGDYDVMSCFGNLIWIDNDPADYFQQLDWEPQTIKAYLDARKAFLKTAQY